MASTGTSGKLQMDEAQRDFAARYPDYASTGALDRLRSTEYRRLDEQGHVYLDYTGGSLYAESQLQRHFELLRSGIFGNPHSANPTSEATTRHVERTRRYVLRYFNARPEDYILAFTLNASAALNLFPSRRAAAFCSRSTITIP
jgi:molybdenum cofactor sulfurtransferase